MTKQGAQKARFHSDEDEGVYFVRDRGTPHPAYGLRFGGMIMSAHATLADAQAEAALLNAGTSASAVGRTAIEAEYAKARDAVDARHAAERARLLKRYNDALNDLDRRSRAGAKGGAR